MKTLIESDIKLFPEPIASLLMNWTKEEFRGVICSVEDKLRDMHGSIEMTKSDDGCEFGRVKHTFVDGAYIRQITMLAGAILTSKIHKIKHPYFVLSGECTVLSEDGLCRIMAPYWGVTEPGIKRLIYVHKETVWVTVHATDSTDLSIIEDEVIARSFGEFDSFITPGSVGEINGGSVR